MAVKTYAFVVQHLGEALHVKQWMQKLIDQFDFDWAQENGEGGPSLSEEKATLLFIIDTYNKQLLEIKGRPVRKVREILDEFAEEIAKPQNPNLEKVLFRFRQFFNNYRLDEYTYLQRTIEDFRSILWDFVDQIAEDLACDKADDEEIQHNLDELKEAVQANSIDLLKSKSRQFIDSYMEFQGKKEQRRNFKMDTIRKNLTVVKKQLVQANQNLRLDHLTQAYNRKSFDDRLNETLRLHRVSQQPVTLLLLDIDHFKKINDNYGHPIGDFILKELVKLLHESFQRESDFVARIGGEEFAIILPDYSLEQAAQKAEQTLERVRQEVFVEDGAEIRFTLSMGLGAALPGESPEDWLKRTDEALYESKNSGRNRYTLSQAKQIRLTG